MIQGLLQTLIDMASAFFGGLMLLRFWLSTLRIRPPMQLGQFILTLTNWLAAPLSRIIPGNWGSLVGAFLIALAAGAAKSLTLIPVFMPKVALILALISLVNWVIYGIMGLLILEVIFSWVNPYAPLASLIAALNQPFLAPIRRFIPPIAGLDLSVMAAFIILNIAGRFLPELIFRLVS